MGKILDEPPYPVVDSAPDFWTTGGLGRPLHCLLRMLSRCLPLWQPRYVLCAARGTHNGSQPLGKLWLRAVGNFNLRDVGVMAAATGISLPLGYAAGGWVNLCRPAGAQLDGQCWHPASSLSASCTLPWGSWAKSCVHG